MRPQGRRWRVVAGTALGILVLGWAVRAGLMGSQTGIASYYGPGFQGKTTASGEPFEQEAMTAAHPSLPFGTSVRVTNLENGREVVVRINDRGPFVPGRIIDVSAAAAEKLGMVNSGVARVKVEVVEGAVAAGRSS
jgi:rare lipoprotein A